MNRFYLAFVLCLSSLAYGASFERYDSTQKLLWINQYTESKVQPRQSVCVYERKQLVGCGVVQTQSIDVLAVRVAKVNYLPERDTKVSVQLQVRKVSSVEEETEVINTTAHPKYVTLDAGIEAGTNYYYPALHFQYAFSRDFSMGVQGMYASYSNGGNAITGYGGYVTATYYYTHPAFRGVMFEGGVGIVNVKAAAGLLTQQSSALSAKASVGWRGRALWDLGLDIGVAAGLQYIGGDTSVLDISFHGVLPMLTAYIGYSF